MMLPIALLVFGLGGPIKSVKCTNLPEQPGKSVAAQECVVILRKPAGPGEELIVHRSTGPTTWGLVEGTTVRTIREIMSDKITGVQYRDTIKSVK